MKWIEALDYKDMSEKAAQMIIKKIKNSHKVVLGFATGGTPLGTYQELVDDAQKNFTSYHHVHTFNLDEYVGLPKEHPNSYHSYMRINLFDYLDIPLTQIHIPDGLADDLEQECQKYEQLIQREGGIDLQILGIGLNGHIGFNEPGTSFDSPTHIVKLAETTRKANAGYFSSPDSIPTYAITMGIQTIMKSKEIILLVSGKPKADILSRLYNDTVQKSLPASILKTHPHVTVIADREALSQITWLNNGIYGL